MPARMRASEKPESPGTTQPMQAVLEVEASQAKSESNASNTKPRASAGLQHANARSADVAGDDAGKSVTPVATSVRSKNERDVEHEKGPAGMAEPSTNKAHTAPDIRALQENPATSPVVAKVEDKSKMKINGPRQGFKTLEYIVYPAHGVGQITAIEEQEVAGYKLELFVISFIKDKMILKVPVPKVTSVGMRKLAEAPVVKRALDTLTGRARVKRTMWSRRAQEYEAKINSGDLVSIAEVVRDLYRSDAQPEQSYSERQLYEAALDRIAREIAAVQKLTDQEALKVIEEQLLKSPRRAKVEEADAEDADDNEADSIVAAA